ncbi:GIP [Symbiodinium pilosum]|uniref:GIP protein n=1 Tax=Symbiodinium pilosum TaxID=2952 RepID=A0A812NXX1_SYMPI|nr:GIP [Symbiodinium pilosum]
MLARMDELMAMVSIATSDDDFREKRQRIASKLRKTSYELMRATSPGRAREEDVSGSEVWEGVDPPSHHDSALVIKELLQRSREADEVAKLAKLISFQAVQLEVNGRRTQAAEQRCEALEQRAKAAEHCVEALEKELELRRRRADLLEAHRRMLAADNLELQKRLQKAKPLEKEGEASASASAAYLHREATQLLEKLSHPRTRNAADVAWQDTQHSQHGQGTARSPTYGSGSAGRLVPESLAGDAKLRWADWRVQNRPSNGLHIVDQMRKPANIKVPKGSASGPAGHASAPTPRFAVTGIPSWSRRTLPPRVETARPRTGMWAPFEWCDVRGI